VVWELTLKCDLGCKHCGSRAGFKRPDELTTAECVDLIGQMAELGIREVTVIGGEAYLRPDWDVLVAEITRQGMGATMTTGARNLSQERVNAAAAAGMKSISISLDGLEETHDAQRGAKGSWKSAVEAARRVVDAGIRLTTNTQINRLSMPELPGVADLMVELDSKAWQIQLTVPMGRAADRPDLLLQPYDLLEVFPLVVWIKQNKLDPAGIRLQPGNNFGYFGPYEELLRFKGKYGTHWTGCSAGRYSLGIEADGKIKGCPSLSSEVYTGGNIRDMTLSEIVWDTPELARFRDKELTREKMWGYCDGCYYADVCRGGCNWTSHVLLDRPGNNPYCIHRALEFEKQGLRERVAKVEQAPGKPFDNGRFEIIVEPVPDPTDEGAKLMGLDVAKVIALQSKDLGVWTPEVIRDRLTKR